MQIRLTLAAVLAMALAIALSPSQGLQAAPMFGPGSQIGTDGLTLVQDKAKAAPKAKAKAKASKGKRVASKGPGRCGTGNYWKKGACVSAATTTAAKK